MSTCLVSTVNAAKMCLGTPVVLATGISITCGLLLTSISVTCAASSVNVGGTISCSANVQPNNASDKGVTWSSNPPGVATVDSSGVVTGVTAGTVTITATAVDGSNVFGTTSITVGGSGGSSAANVAAICAAPYNANYFPYKECLGGVVGDNNANTWSGGSCTTQSGATELYGKSRCSSQTDSGYGYGFGTFRSVNYEPTDDKGTTGANCWCQLCSDSTRTSCGAWLFYNTYSSVAECSLYCADYMGGFGVGCSHGLRFTNDIYGWVRSFRQALCAAP